MARDRVVRAGGGNRDQLAGLIGLAGFGYPAIKFGRGVWDLVVHGSIGGIMMGAASVVGLCLSIAALAAPKSAQ